MTLRSKYIDNRRIRFPSRWMERPKHDWPPINKTLQLSFLPMLISITRAILLLHSSGDGITLSLVGGTLDEVVLEWSLAVGAWRLYWLMQLSVCVSMCIYQVTVCVCVCKARAYTLAAINNTEGGFTQWTLNPRQSNMPNHQSIHCLSVQSHSPNITLDF